MEEYNFEKVELLKNLIVPLLHIEYMFRKLDFDYLNMDCFYNIDNQDYFYDSNICKKIGNNNQIQKAGLNFVNFTEGLSDLNYFLARPEFMRGHLINKKMNNSNFIIDRNNKNRILKELLKESGYDSLIYLDDKKLLKETTKLGNYCLRNAHRHNIDTENKMISLCKEILKKTINIESSTLLISLFEPSESNNPHMNFNLGKIEADKDIIEMLKEQPLSLMFKYYTFIGDGMQYNLKTDANDFLEAVFVNNLDNVNKVNISLEKDLINQDIKLSNDQTIIKKRI